MRYRLKTALIFGALSAAAIGATQAYAWEYDVLSQDPPVYDAKDPKLTPMLYKPVEKASKPWRICISLPNLADPYWLAIDYGFVAEAKERGVKVQVVDAGGYDKLSRQVSQVEDCASRGVDALILGSISFTGLDHTVDALAARGIPTIDIQNGVSSPKVRAHSISTSFDMTHALGLRLAKLHPAGSNAKVLFLPGPAGATWAEQMAKGFVAGIGGSGLTIVDTKYGETDKATQIRLVEDGLQAHPDVDYIVGNAVAIEGAAQLVRERGLSKLKLAATYQTQGVVDLVKQGRASMVVSDSNVMQARIALDQAIRVLEKKEYVPFVTQITTIVDTENVKSWDETSALAPANFRPVFSVK
jgi:protein TorT